MSGRRLNRRRAMQAATVATVPETPEPATQEEHRRDAMGRLFPKKKAAKKKGARRG